MPSKVVTRASIAGTVVSFKVSTASLTVSTAVNLGSASVLKDSNAVTLVSKVPTLVSASVALDTASLTLEVISVSLVAASLAAWISCLVSSGRPAVAACSMECSKACLAAAKLLAASSLASVILASNPLVVPSSEPCTTVFKAATLSFTKSIELLIASLAVVIFASTASESGRASTLVFKPSTASLLAVTLGSNSSALALAASAVDFTSAMDAIAFLSS